MCKLKRKDTIAVKVGSVYIGGSSPISVQSMTNSDTRDVKATIEQIVALEAAGCEIVRVAVVDHEAAVAIKEIKKCISIPIVADIHFNYQLAIESIKNGVDKIRINPGNIKNPNHMKEIAEVAKSYDIPIRIGINSGCIDKSLLKNNADINCDLLVRSAIDAVNLFESFSFNKLVLSIKSSDIALTIESYRALSKITNYPLHLGATEVGTTKKGVIRQAIVIGTLLSEGIGDTIRVSLTGDHLEEITAGKEILEALNIRNEGLKLVSCPTCGRCQVDLVPLVEEFERVCSMRNLNTKKMKVAIMGCAVNGPGEASDADIGIAGGKGEFLVFKGGKAIGKVAREQAIERLVYELENI